MMRTRAPSDKDDGLIHVAVWESSGPRRPFLRIAVRVPPGGGGLDPVRLEQVRSTRGPKGMRFFDIRDEHHVRPLLKHSATICDDCFAGDACEFWGREGPLLAQACRSGFVAPFPPDSDRAPLLQEQRRAAERWDEDIPPDELFEELDWE